MKYSIYFFVSLFLLSAILTMIYPKLKRHLHRKQYSPEKYEALLTKIQKGEIYVSDSKKQKQRSNILIEDIFPFWYGTPWHFYGTTQVPGRGKIACGYFVTTVLEDMGVKLDRIRLAQATSESMIKELIPANKISRFSNKSIQTFIKAVQQEGDGVYIVGLDTHNGFITCENKKVFFVHSSGRYPWCVVKEEALYSGTLVDSKYRVLGKIF